MVVLDGRQIMKYSFENFVYERPVLDVPFEYVPFVYLLQKIGLGLIHYGLNSYRDEPSFGFRYPPYTQDSLAIFAEALKLPIPAPIQNGNKA